MDKIEYRSIIKFLHLKRKTPTEIKAELDSVYGKKAAPSFSTVKSWVAEFKRGRTSLVDEDRSGRPKTATTEEIIEKVHKLVIDDRQIKLRELAEAAGISSERVLKILHDDLHMRTLYARWVPRLLTTDHKHTRMTTAKELLDQFKRNTQSFLRQFITVDQTWFHYHKPETEVKTETPPIDDISEPSSPKKKKKAKPAQSAGKVMATVFWDTCGILFIDYLQEGTSMTGAYYASLLDRLKSEIETKRPKKRNEKVLFHQDNTPVHTSLVAMAKLNNYDFELIPHPQYSPDLAPSSYFLFPNMKKWLGGKRFLTAGEVTAAVDGYFGDLSESYYLEGIEKMEQRWMECIQLKGEYVEK